MAFPLIPQPKPEPRIVQKVAKRRAVARLDRQEKEAVRQRDNECCRVCFRKSREVHERIMKSLGGAASLENSCCLCRKCHQYAHAHGLRIFPTFAGRGCNGPVTFAMCAAVAHDIFRRQVYAQACRGDRMKMERQCPLHGPLVGVRYCPECASMGKPWTEEQALRADLEMIRAREAK